MIKVVVAVCQRPPESEPKLQVVWVIPEDLRRELAELDSEPYYARAIAFSRFLSAQSAQEYF
jgi:hypothetical protein